MQITGSIVYHNYMSFTLLFKFHENCLNIEKKKTEKSKIITRSMLNEEKIRTEENILYL